MFLLDTNVISELRKARTGKADPNVTAWMGTIPAGSLFLSVIVIQELEISVLLAERRDPAKGAILRKWLDDHVLPSFSERILPIDTIVARRSTALHVPHLRPVRDGLIVATALVHGMTVVTRNLADFVPTGVLLLNPWQASPSSGHPRKVHVT
jgi:predicted nucleic acid-binding protein